MPYNAAFPTEQLLPETLVTSYSCFPEEATMASGIVLPLSSAFAPHHFIQVSVPITLPCLQRAVLCDRNQWLQQAVGAVHVPSLNSEPPSRPSP